MYTKILHFFIAISITLPALAQNVSKTSPSVLYSSNTIKITAALQTCTHTTSPKKEQFDFYVLQIENTSKKAVTITFRVETYDGSKCISCMAGDPPVYTYTIQAEKTIRPTCEFKKYNNLMINRNYSSTKPSNTIDFIKITNVTIQ